jgi:hypothetical protein
MADENFMEFTSELIEENTIVFQVDDENGNPKEVIKINDDGFFIYGEFLKSADDVAAAFRHFFSQSGYDIDQDGRIIAEEVDTTSELGKENNKDD